MSHRSGEYTLEKAGVSYIEALPPEKHSEMHMFLRLFQGTFDKAKSLGLERTNVDAFIKTYRYLFGVRDLSPDYARKKSKGICSWCSEPAVPGMSLCAKHRDKRNAHERKRREEGQREKVRCH